MRLFRNAIVLAGLGALGCPAVAQDDFPFLHPDAVRTAYDSAKADWPPLHPLIAQAFMIAADKHFRERAPMRSVITGTITNWYPAMGSQRSLAVSAAIGASLDRDEILNWYVHGIFLGRRCYGVDAAAAAYFGKPTGQLDLHEIAWLAALPPVPSAPSDKQLRARNLLLAEMAEAGVIDKAAADAAASRPSGLVEPPQDCPAATR